jgi:hypothetical protein
MLHNVMPGAVIRQLLCAGLCAESVPFT